MKRQSHRDNAHHDRPRKNDRRPIRLAVEPLEARRLLAGLNVSVLIDQDGSRSANAADTAASRRVVFLDLNNNGVQDSADPVAFTNERGIASFDGIAAGDYAVGIASGSTHQSQSFPVRVDELATNVGPAAKILIASDDLSKVWAFDGDGSGQQVTGSSDAPKVRLGGAVVSSVSVGNESWIVLRSSNSLGGTKLVQFNLSSGRQSTSEVRGLNGRVIEKLVKAGNEVVAQLSGLGGPELAKVVITDGIPTVGVSASFPNLLTVAGAADELAIVEARSTTNIQTSSAQQPLALQMSPQANRLSILSLDDFSEKASTFLPQSANEISVTADGSLILAALSTGGVMVLNNDATLSAEATLAEASGPLLTQSIDGRVVTGTLANASEFIVWDTSSWQPTGRTRIATPNQNVPAQSNLTTKAISSVAFANSGDRFVATGMTGTFTSQLAEAATAAVTIPADGVATVQLGVRVDGLNRAPTAPPVTVTLLEDNSASGDLRTQVTDVNNDTLWFSLLNAPSQGSLQVSPAGDWSYRPAANFSGTDRAIVRVFDGQTSKDMALVLNITPVNDPPDNFRANVTTVPESFQSSDEAIGFVTIYDVDQGASYHYDTSDSRFEVRNGKIYLLPGAKLDYETEPTIEFEITAIEDAVSGYQISTTATISIADVNEAPTLVRILNTSVPENLPAATIGQVQIDDPDSINNFSYVVTDSRFTVENGFLKLKPGVALDFEASNSIILSITVSDSSGQSVTQPMTITVADQNDAPTSINVQTQPVQEATAGAVVGTISVSDQDGQGYNYTVSDPRFEVVDGELKLRDGQSVSRSADQNLSLTVMATSFAGSDSIATTVAVSVVTKKSSNQNPVEPRDVNGDGQISPLDALILINYINSFGAGPIGGNAPHGSGEGQIWIDVNGDGAISPLDILIIINWLNNRRFVQVEDVKAEGEANQTPPSSGVPSPLVVTSTTAFPQALAGSAIFSASRSNSEVLPSSVNLAASQNIDTRNLACPAVETLTDSEIDHELESLLDQLTRERLANFSV